MFVCCAYIIIRCVQGIQIRIKTTPQLSLKTCKKIVCGSKTNELELTHHDMYGIGKISIGGM